MTSETLTNEEKEMAEISNSALLRAAVKINTILLALVFGFVCGVGLFIITYISLLRGLPNPGTYLNLLGVFLPGYNVSHMGAFIGLFWGTIIGASLSAVFYRIYARGIPKLVQEYLKEGLLSDDMLSKSLRMGGHSLGLALGIVIASGLIITTNWLVLRGTASASVHAQLLVNYLPGYSVSLTGSLLGALELLVIIYMLSRLFSTIYNIVAELRNKKSSRAS